MFSIAKNDRFKFLNQFGVRILHSMKVIVKLLSTLGDISNLEGATQDAEVIMFVIFEWTYHHGYCDDSIKSF